MNYGQVLHWVKLAIGPSGIFLYLLFIARIIVKKNAFLSHAELGFIPTPPVAACVVFHKLFK